MIGAHGHSPVQVHFARQYMGLPWVNGAEGPEAYDCWGLVRHILAHHFEIDVPAVDIDANCTKACALAFEQGRKSGKWAQVTIPQEGDVALMAHAKYPSHIGIWLDADHGGVLHCVRGAGVIYSDLTKLRLSGWGKIEYYRYASSYPSHT